MTSRLPSFFLFCLISLLFGCSSKPSPSYDVLVSIAPYTYFVRELTNGELSTLSLSPPGSNPHLYEPTPRLVEEARHAKVWIRVGESFEQRVALALREQSKAPLELNLAKQIPLLEQPCHCCHHHHHEGTLEEADLHFWTSLRLAKQQAELIADVLIEAFPPRKEQITRNLSLLLQKFHDTDLLLTKELAPFAGQAIVISHPALGYFCHDYQLEQLSIEEEGKDPLPKRITALLDSAATLKIRTVFTLVQYNNKGAEKIAHQLHLPIHEIDAYSEDYLQNFLTIANFIVNP